MWIVYENLKMFKRGIVVFLLCPALSGLICCLSHIHPTILSVFLGLRVWSKPGEEGTVGHVWKEASHRVAGGVGVLARFVSCLVSFRAGQAVSQPSSRAVLGAVLMGVPLCAGRREPVVVDGRGAGQRAKALLVVTTRYPWGLAPTFCKAQLRMALTIILNVPQRHLKVVRAIVAWFFAKEIPF